MGEQAVHLQFKKLLQRLVKLGLLPFEFRREVLDLCFFKKCLKGFIDLNNSKAVLSTGRFQRDVFKFLFLDHIVDLWNSLPVAIKITDQLSLFSNKVNEFLY